MSEDFKYEWSGINPGSVALDIGGYEANWSAEISRRYHPRILLFEPILSFYDECHQRMEKFSNVDVYHNAIGATSGEDTLMVSGDSTGAFNKNPQATPEKVSTIGIMQLLELFKLPSVDLMKLNCEGAEFQILETILNHGIANKFPRILVQPHTVVPDYASRWKAIEDKLSETHNLTFSQPWIWQRWEAR